MNWMLINLHLGGLLQIAAPALVENDDLHVVKQEDQLRPPLDEAHLDDPLLYVSTFLNFFENCDKTPARANHHFSVRAHIPVHHLHVHIVNPFHNVIVSFENENLIFCENIKFFLFPYNFYDFAAEAHYLLYSLGLQLEITIHLYLYKVTVIGANVNLVLNCLHLNLGEVLNFYWEEAKVDAPEAALGSRIEEANLLQGDDHQVAADHF